MNHRLLDSQSVEQTISIMAGFVDRHCTDLWALDAVQHIVHASNLVDGDIQGLCNAVDDWIMARVKYWQDVEGVETIQSPIVTLQRGMGDCDDMATLAATLLRAAGVKPYIVLMGYDGADYPTHVCCAAAYSNGLCVIDSTVSNKSDTIRGLTHKEIYTCQ